ncbi:MAG: type II toxin-antitoxin system prevent-host-death family antitoxin [Akkermansiaceae bacterium]|jgi:prevent-host-death family protein|nr:type II toxin-antitoxin system prevent-host-death family antitoxin [Akkermansiaceae bacterium]MDP4646870.1 type II toxin-antitoxin system prevent-host-death family antitoxin [Akkermansiaceae bacterium]MDP4721434.1 type II toxin-antitoxin system prevent-host-death family antitoxin [Akkermansiaceae bacterium]MDP4778938.1 type II toxin-antitoxin system prevent-host-death family antitoxin [Akkermansiaceae bacterium]MDP4845794.1 type II toxin-antitoxin system prevent-host-death family antitoxin [
MKNIQEAKTHLSRLVEQAAAGKEIIIAKAGRPMAKLVPYIPPRPARIGGFLAGQIQEAPDCWEPDESLLEAMTGGSVFPAERASKVAENEAPYRS